jgi:dihydroorotase
MNNIKKSTNNKLVLPLWADLHAHFRQGDLTKILANEYLKMGCYAVLAMPNTLPVVGKVLNDGAGKELPYWSIVDYKKSIEDAFENKLLDVMVPLYITKDTTTSMILEGANKGILRAVKYYPPHATTNSDHGVSISDLINSDLLKAIEDADIVLCIHGEEHHIGGHRFFDKETNAEIAFYQKFMPLITKKYPKLRIVAEHITTKTAVDFVNNSSKNVVATITPQHLLYTIGDLLLTKSTHLVCMPYVKFEEDKNALLQAVTNINNSKFFAGTDNAPHTKLSKQTDCGCAAGCYVGGIAPQLYAMAFENFGVDIFSFEGYTAFKKFLCDLGPEYYGLPKSPGTFELVKENSKVSILNTNIGDIIPLPLGMVKDEFRFNVEIPWKIENIKRS